MQAQESIVAKKYAVAFCTIFANRINEKDIESWQLLYAFIKKHRYIYALFCMPNLSYEAKEKAFCVLLSFFKVPSILEKLVRLVLKDGRIDSIDIILEALINEYNTRHRIESFKILSSHELTQQQKKEMINFIQSLTAYKVIAHYIIDPKLIVGLRVQSNSRLWERSIRKELLEVGSIIAQKGMP